MIWQDYAFMVGGFIFAANLWPTARCYVQATDDSQRPEIWARKAGPTT